MTHAPSRPVSDTRRASALPRPRIGDAFAQRAGAALAGEARRRRPGRRRPRPTDDDDIVVTAPAARGESAGRADRDHRARHRDARRAPGRRFRRLCPARAEPLLPDRSGPGFANVYFRGVASGENANHSASLPSVGTYLDEQPITTITGALDLHIFDIARVEALAGPQGTLYGASSQAGTVRIITNQPDTSGFYGEVNVELNNVAHGDIGGYTGEGFVNAPLSSNVALRVVGWYRHDAGYIDNIPGTPDLPDLRASPSTNDAAGRGGL